MPCVAREESPAGHSLLFLKTECVHPATPLLTIQLFSYKVCAVASSTPEHPWTHPPTSADPNVEVCVPFVVVLAPTHLLQ